MATAKKKTTKRKQTGLSQKKLKPRKNAGCKGDGFELIPLKKDGTPAKYDKYGNLVTEFTGRGKGVHIKDYWAVSVASKSVEAKSPDEINEVFDRPYWSLNQMPIAWVRDRLKRYFSSITVPLYKLPEDDDPIYNNNNIIDNSINDLDNLSHSSNNSIALPDNATIIAFKYKRNPTISGLAQTLGISSVTFRNYCIGNASGQKPYMYMNEYVNLYYKDDDLNFLTRNDCNYVSGLSPKERNQLAADNSIKLNLCKRAYLEVESFHESRLGSNENVSGSIFALLNMHRGWKNDQKLEIEAGKGLLGELKSKSELQEMSKVIEMTDCVSDSSDNSTNLDNSKNLDNSDKIDGFDD